MKFKDYIDDNTALIMVDLQNDFGDPEGSLYVKGGEDLVDIVNEAYDIYNDLGNINILWTMDSHPADHCSFVENNGLWPAHCVVDCWGWKFMENLRIYDYPDTVIRKGTNKDIDSYSAFFDNEKKSCTKLDSYLKARKIKKNIVMGLATEYCDKFTVMDSLFLGYETAIYLPGCRGVNLKEGDVDNAILEMEKAGAVLLE